MARETTPTRGKRLANIITEEPQPITPSNMNCGDSRGDTEGRARRSFRSILTRASTLTQQTHSSGCRVPFSQVPPLTNRDVALTKNWKAPEDQHSHQKWMQLVAAGQAEVVTDNSPGYYSHSFLIPKKRKGEFRLISDLRRLNKFARHRHSKTPTLANALPNSTQNAWLSTFDVRDGYFNVPIHKDYRRHFRFNVGNTTCQMRCSPMGCVESMNAFRAWLAPFIETIRACCPEVFVFTYVDDALLIVPPQRFRDARAILDRVRRTTAALALPLKEHKSGWTLSHALEHLGFLIDAKRMAIAVPKKKAKAITHQIKKTLRQANKGTLRVRHLASTIGQLLALLPAVKHARLHARRLFQTQAQAVNAHGWAANSLVRLDAPTRAELLWWTNYLQLLRLYPLDHHRRCKEIHIVATDAADNMIAGVLISDPDLPHWSRRLSRSEKRSTIAVKELRAVVESVGRFPKLTGGLLNFRVDNQVVVAAVNRWGTKQQEMLPLLEKLHTWTLKTGTRITCTYVHTKANTFADGSSRGRAPTPEDRIEALLLAQGAKATRKGAHWRITKAHRRHLFEAFHTRPRRSLQGPLTFTDDPLPTGFLPTLTDAGTKTKLPSSFCFPNLQQIQRVLTTIAKLGLTETLVLLPLWPSAPWFNFAAHLACSRPMLLPPTAVRPHGQRNKSWPGWHWIGVKLSGSKRKRTEYRLRLPSRRGLHQALKNATPPAGGSSARTRKRAMDCLQRFQEISAQARY